MLHLARRQPADSLSFDRESVGRLTVEQLRQQAPTCCFFDSGVIVAQLNVVVRSTRFALLWFDLNRSEQRMGKILDLAERAWSGERMHIAVSETRSVLTQFSQMRFPRLQ